MSRCLPFLLPFFDRFPIDLGSQLRPPKSKKSLELYWFYSVFCKMSLSKLRSIFDTILMPTWTDFASRKPPKSIQKPTPRSIKILIDFWIDYFGNFGAILAQSPAKLAISGAILAPKTRQLGPQEASKSWRAVTTFRHLSKLAPQDGPRPILDQICSDFN